jgi:predicted nucleic acid-binding protein
MPNAKTNCFVDTTVIVYSVDPRDRAKQHRAVNLLSATISNSTLVLSPQSLNETYRVISDKRFLMARPAARDFVGKLARFSTAPLDYAALQQAWLLQDETNYNIWDCLLLASASLAGCGYFFSEDLQHERQILNLKVLNPFALETIDHLPI